MLGQRAADAVAGELGPALVLPADDPVPVGDGGRDPQARRARRRGRRRARRRSATAVSRGSPSPDRSPCPSTIQTMASPDQMPLEGWDHVQLWVGNAKQSAYYYEHAFGFHRHAYAGPETGVRDRASYVLRQGEVDLVLSSALAADHEITRFACTHGDGVRDIAMTRAERGRGVSRRDRAGCARRARARVDRGRIRPRRDRVGRDLRRGRPLVRRPRGLRRAVPARVRGGRVRGRRRRRADAARPLRRQRRAREDGRVGGLVRAGARLREHRPLRRRADSHRVLGADVEGDVGRRGEDQVPDQRAGRGAPQEPDRRVPRLQRGARRAARRDPDRRHRPHGRGDAGARRRLPADAGDLLRGRVRPGRRDRRVVGGPAPAADPRRPRRGRLPAPDLHEDGAGPADALLRGDPAARRAHLRRGQLQGAVRGDRARAGPARQPLASARSLQRR